MRLISDIVKRAWKGLKGLNTIRSRAITKTITWALVLVVFFFVGRYVATNWNAIGNVGAPKPGWLIAACLIGFLSYVIHPYALKILIEGHGPDVPYSRVLGLCYLPGLGKYVPGRIWGFVTGLYLFSKEGIPKHIAATCIMLFTSLGIATPLLIVLFFGIHWAIGFVGIWSVIILALLTLAIFLCISPPILYPVINYFLRWIRRPEIDTGITTWRLYQALLIMVASNIIYGLGFTCLVRSLATVPWHETFFLMSLIVFCEVIGFLALFAPAGIGVREGMLMAGLAPLVGAGPAIVISGVARVWGTALEFIMIGLGGVGLRYFGPKNSDKSYKN
jgi:hypothetical protein